MEINDISLFKNIEAKNLEDIKSKAKQRVYPKGTIVFIEGQESDGLYVITKGHVKVSRLTSDGREKIITFLGEGEFFGEMTLYGSDTRSATIEALELTNVLVIRRSDFKMLILAIPCLAERIIENLSERLRALNQQVQELVFLNARSRVICSLLELAAKHGKLEEGTIKISIRLTHSELAKMVGVSRETVTKILLELQDRHLINFRDRYIIITDHDELYKQVIKNG